ncbi:geranylgeranyl reductase family protein, partial [bacterium]|nr:geranylgeranyl reductase family protein [bacterium]
YGARVRFGDDVIEMLKPSRIAALVTRSKFDYFLVQQAIKAGAKFLENEKVSDLQISREYVDITTSTANIRAKLVIGADGSQGITSHYIHDTIKGNEYAIGLVTEIPADNRDIDKYIFNSIEIHFGITSMGYGWVFPHEEYFNVGVAVIADKLCNPKKILANFLRERGFHGQYRFHAHRIPMGGVPKKNVADRIILVGDAAGFVDSFYGEGIAYAILSGKIAANVCHNALQRNDGWKEDFLKIYNDECYKQFEYNLKYSLILAKLMHRFPKLFLKLMASDKNVLGRYLDVAGNNLTYKEYLRWMEHRAPLFLMQRAIKKMLILKHIR